MTEQVAALNLVTETQATLIAALEAKIADLEERLARTPRTSSMPPSKEGLSKPPAENRAARRAAKRRPGKQPGAEGNNLAQVPNPDKVVPVAPETCTGCGGDLSDADVVDVDTRQVFELPEIRPYVTEYRIERRRCRCGCEVKGTVPDQATAPACYGPGVRGLAVYLAIYQHLPYDRMAQLFSDVFGLPISVGTLTAIVAEAGGKLGVFSDVVRDLLREAPLVNFDETGARVEGKLQWVHVASSALYTLLSGHERRGKVAMDDMGVITNMVGIAQHDGWKPYRSYGVVHALCNAHHKRELDNLAPVVGQEWADEMIGLLIEAKKATEEAKAKGEDHLDPSSACTRSASATGGSSKPAVPPTLRRSPASATGTGRRRTTSWSASTRGAPTCSASPPTSGRAGTTTRPSAT